MRVGHLTGPIHYGRSGDGETPAPRIGMQELRTATEPRRRLSEVLFAESGKVGRRSKPVVRSDLGDALIRIANLVKDTLGTALVEPLVHRAFEFGLELALETAHAHVREGRKAPHVADIAVMLEDEILEVVVIAHDIMQQGVQLFRRMVAAKKNTQLLLFDLMVMDAVQTVVQSPGQRREKHRNRFFNC